ncbi:hypothetical protein J6590_034416 [Homalodisca vitripennis]|nr:hypothetical protein J6590_034416 [Homalodisca vitripennis]
MLSAGTKYDFSIAAVTRNGSPVKFPPCQSDGRPPPGLAYDIACHMRKHTICPERVAWAGSPRTRVVCVRARGQVVAIYGHGHASRRGDVFRIGNVSGRLNSTHATARR